MIEPADFEGGIVIEEDVLADGVTAEDTCTEYCEAGCGQKQTRKTCRNMFSDIKKKIFISSKKFLFDSEIL